MTYHDIGVIGKYLVDHKYLNIFFLSTFTTMKKI